MALKFFVLIPSCYMQSYIVVGSIGPELHAMRMICLLRAATPAWVINTTPFLIAINYIRYSGSFDILQAKVKRLLSVGPVRLKQTSLRARWTNLCIFHVFYLGLLGEHLGQVS